MREIRIVCVVILLCLLMVSVPRESYSFALGTSDVVIAQTPHAPIAITSEADFISLGFAGDGSPTDPYIIEDLTIESVAGESCISVSGNITSSYVIRSCNISGTVVGESEELTAAGVYLSAGVGKIEDCTFSECIRSVGFEGLNDVLIQDSTFNIPESVWQMYSVMGLVGLNLTNVSILRCEFRGAYPDESIILVNVSDALISDCTMESSIIINAEQNVNIESCSMTHSHIAIHNGVGCNINRNTLSYSCIILGSENSRVYNNTLLRCGNTGIQIDSNNSEVYDNVIEGYGPQNYFGLAVGGDNCDIYGNEISNFFYGIVMHGSGNDIYNNTIHDCSVCGVVMVSYSSDNRFYYNHVYRNDVNAHDDGTNNIWDDGIDTGNRWDDAWSAPYQINGSANAVDRYPIIIQGVDIALAVVFTGLAIAVVVIVLVIKTRKT